MKMSLRWRISPELERTLKRDCRAAMARVATRLGILTVGVGLPTWHGLLLLTQLSVPRRSQIAAHVAIGLMAAYFWLLPLRFYFPLSAYKLTPQGIGRDPQTTGFTWQRCTHFTLKNDEEHPDTRQAIVTNDRGRVRHLILPDDGRMQDLIVRYLARKLPYQESAEPRKTG